MSISKEGAPVAFANPTDMFVMEGDTAWRKSTKSQTSNCVEAAGLGPVVGVRDSKERGGAVLNFRPDSWRAFTACVASGAIGKPELS